MNGNLLACNTWALDILIPFCEASICQAGIWLSYCQTSCARSWNPFYSEVAAQKGPTLPTDPKPSPQHKTPTSTQAPTHLQQHQLQLWQARSPFFPSQITFPSPRLLCLGRDLPHSFHETHADCVTIFVHPTRHNYACADTKANRHERIPLPWSPKSPSRSFAPFKSTGRIVTLGKSHSFLPPSSL